MILSCYLIKMWPTIFRHFTNSFHGNQLFGNIRNTFEMKDGFSPAFKILKLSVLDNNLCGSVQSSIHPVYYTSFLNTKKTTQKLGHLSSLKVEYLENGMRTRKKFKQHEFYLHSFVVHFFTKKFIEVDKFIL